MDDEQKWEFWRVKWQSDARRWRAWIGAIVGSTLSLAALILQPGHILIVLALVIVIGLAAVGGAASNAVGDHNHRPPEPTLELLDEKYRAKATGNDGINALTVIVAFKEQEHAKAARLLVLIGAAFGLLALAIGAFSENVIPSVISGAFGVLFVAWARNVRNIRLKGFGIEVATTEGNKKKK